MSALSALAGGSARSMTRWKPAGRAKRTRNELARRRRLNRDRRLRVLSSTCPFLLVALLVARRGRFRPFVRAALPGRAPMSVPLTQRSASGFGHQGSVATGPERHDGGGSLPTRWARPAAKPLGRTLTQFDARFEWKRN